MAQIGAKRNQQNALNEVFDVQNVCPQIYIIHWMYMFNKCVAQEQIYPCLWNASCFFSSFSRWHGRETVLRFYSSASQPQLPAVVSTNYHQTVPNREPPPDTPVRNTSSSQQGLQDGSKTADPSAPVGLDRSTPPPWGRVPGHYHHHPALLLGFLLHSFGVFLYRCSEAAVWWVH